MGDVTEWIAQARQGDRDALGRIFDSLYPELRRIAHRRLVGHQRNILLDTSVLVHECFMRFANAERLSVNDRTHFLAYCATAMRSIIVDWARGAKAERRGGGVEHVPLDTETSEGAAQAEDQILDIDAALSSLARLDPRLAQVVEMRYFGGMTDQEIGEALGLTDRTVRRDWEKARVLLAHEMRG